jgi:hypothetical protein
MNETICILLYIATIIIFLIEDITRCNQSINESHFRVLVGVHTTDALSGAQ